MSKPVLSIAGAVLVVALFAFGASGAGYPRPGPRAVIAAALGSHELQATARYFRRTQGGQRCVLHNGGMGPNWVGTCWTDVWLHGDGSATVRLMISPPYTEKPGTTWVFHVSRSLHARLLEGPKDFTTGAEA